MAQNPEATGPQQVHWRDKAIIAAAGSNPEAIRALLDRNSHPAPSDAALYQWKSRGAIPNHWRPALIHALLVEKRVSVDQLFCRAPLRAHVPAA
jgi:hypothetical protein